MAFGSIVLAFAAGLCIALGVLTTPFPLLGSVFSFAAPVLALLGIALGGRAMGRARDRGRRSTAGLVGVVFNAMALPPALGVALTCGAFNAALSNGSVQTTTSFQVSQGTGAAATAGTDTAPTPPPFAPARPDAGAAATPAPAPTPSGNAPPTAAPAQREGTPPPPASQAPLPPPPLPPE